MKITKIKNKETNKVEKLNFSLKYWASFVNYYSNNNHQNSGDYIFRPIKGEFESYDYNHLIGGTISKGANKERMDFFLAS